MANKGIVLGNNYTFSAANKTITFSNDYIGMSLSDITYITNIKSGVATVIYDPFDSTKGGVLDGLTLTLNYNTTTMGDTDPLQIIVGFTPTNNDPLLVKLVEGPDQKDDTDLLNRIADNLDFLNLALDQAEGVQVHTRDANPAKRDANNAQVNSDAIQSTYTLGALNASAIVDTSGYQSIEFFVFGLAGTNLFVFPEISSDSLNWSQVPYFENVNSVVAMSSAGSGVNITTGAFRRIVLALTTKYVRLRVTTYTSGAVSVISTLKQTPLPTGLFTQVPVNATLNITGVYNTNTNSTTGTSGSPFLGTGILNPTNNAPNAVSTLQSSVPYPIGIAGREQPYIGALSGIYRYLTVDGGGRYILGGDTPDTETRTQSKLASGAIPGIPPRGVGAISNNMLGSQSLTVTDTQQSEGDTHTMLLKQILTELKILNQQFAELPAMINLPSYELSDPQEYRDDKTFQ